MLVYRLEKRGIGPYQFHDPTDRGFKDLQNRLRNAHREDICHPAWHEEPELKDMAWKNYYKSGCASLESLIEWFGEFWDDLHAAGFQVIAYITDDYVMTNRQLAFKPR